MNLDPASSALVRPLERRDLPQLLLLCAEHSAFKSAHFTSVGKAEGLERAVFCDPPRLFVWVAARAEVLLGYASVTLDFSTWDAAQFAHLDCLYLQPLARSQGLGRRLLEAVVAFARSQGCPEVQWQTPHWNEDAQRFYRRTGAVQSQKVRFVLTLETLSGQRDIEGEERAEKKWESES